MSQSNEAKLLRGALIPASVVGAISIVIAVIVKGTPGLFGALLAHFVVVIYLGIHILVSKFSRNLDPMSTMALAMFSYVSKLFFVALFLIAISKLTSVDDVHRGTFGAVTIALTLAWLGGEIASFTKLRLHLSLPEKS